MAKSSNENKEHTTKPKLCKEVHLTLYLSKQIDAILNHYNTERKIELAEHLLLTIDDLLEYFKTGKEKAHSAYDVIFADPPYELENTATIHDLVYKNNLLNEDGLLIIEHSLKTNLSNKEFFIDTRKYGNVNFSFFRKTI